jgi:hypothetical protein
MLVATDWEAFHYIQLHERRHRAALGTHSVGEKGEGGALVEYFRHAVRTKVVMAWRTEVWNLALNRDFFCLHWSTVANSFWEQQFVLGLAHIFSRNTVRHD